MSHGSLHQLVVILDWLPYISVQRQSSVVSNLCSTAVDSLDGQKQKQCQVWSGSGLAEEESLLVVEETEPSDNANLLPEVSYSFIWHYRRERREKNQPAVV